MKKENLLSKAEMKKVMGGVDFVGGEPNCYDNCIQGPGDLEGMCTDGSVCIQVPKEGCTVSPREFV